MSNRRLFFERFAKKQGFDPLVASNWYKIKVESMLEKEKVSIQTKEKKKRKEN